MPPRTQLTDDQLAERLTRATSLRNLGYSWEAVAKEVGFTNASHACRDVLKGLEKRRRETYRHVDAFVQAELDKLDMMERLMWQIVNRKHVLAQNGRVVLDPQSQEAMRDDGPLFQATDRLLKIHERRSKLLGLDSPARVDIQVSDEMDQKIKSLLAEMDNPVQEQPLAAD